MEYRILCQPAYTLLELRLAEGEVLVAERGAMVYMKDVKLDTILRKGILKRWLSGESAFLNVFKAERDGAIVGLAPPYNGDIVAIEIGDIVCEKGAFLAGTGVNDIDIAFKVKGLKGLLAGEGFIFQRLKGEGTVFLSSFGGVVEKEVDDVFVVDTGHILAFESSLDYKIRPAGGLKATLLSREGLVMKFEGHGKVWIQTRSIADYVGWLASLLPHDRRES